VGNLFFSLGAVFFPLLTLVTRKFGLVPILLSLGALMAILAARALAQTFPMAGAGDGFHWREARRVVVQPTVIVLAVVLFLYVALEISTAGWTRTHLEQSFGASSRTSRLVLTLFWATQAAGRLMASRLVRALPGPQLVLVSAMGAVLGTLLVVLAPSAWVASVGIGICGLTYAPIFPTSVATASTHFPNLFGTVFGILTAAGLTGAVILPAAIGYVAKETTLTQGLGLLVATALLMLLAQAVCVGLERRHGYRG
jgi:fucose permease